MKRLIVVGIAPCFKEDLARIENHELFDFMVIGVDAIGLINNHVSYIATYHPEDIPAMKPKMKGHEKIVGHEIKDGVDLVCPTLFGQDHHQSTGSSALLGVCWALGAGYERIILVGCPLEGNNSVGVGYEQFRRGWDIHKDKVINNVRSMSGWTRTFLGEPTKEWILKERPMPDSRFRIPPQKVTLRRIGKSEEKVPEVTYSIPSIKVLLSAPIQKDAQIQNWGAPCLGIIRIAEYTRNQFGGDVELLFYDPQIDSFDPLEKWKEEKIDVLGLSLLHYTLFDSLVFLNNFKKQHPETLIVIGGNEAGANYQDIFDKAPVDIIVTAEGEDTFADILNWKMGRKKLEDVDGIIYRKYAKPITNDMLWKYWRSVDFSRFRYEEYWNTLAALYETPDYEKINYVRIMTTSHCQRSCTFCSLANVRNNACGKKAEPVALSGEQIMDLIEKVHKQLPAVRTIYFCTDDVFYPNRQPFLDFIELYKKSGYDYRILIQTSTYSLKEEDFPLLKSINCQHITLGFENCSESLRKSLKKPQKREKMEQIIKWGKEHGIAIYILIMLMPPEVTIDDLKDNYETLSRWLSEDNIQISVEPVIYPYRGTEIFEQGYDFHYEIEERDGVTYRDAKFIWPKDKEARELCEELLERREAFVENYFKDLPHKHMFKGATGVAIISLLGVLLRERKKYKYTYKGV